jgi:hypothetical protein
VNFFAIARQQNVGDRRVRLHVDLVNALQHFPEAVNGVWLPQIFKHVPVTGRKSTIQWLHKEQQPFPEMHTSCPKACDD